MYTPAGGTLVISFDGRAGPPILHNALHDLPVLRALDVALPPGIIDTMILAHHLCDEPQGLKDLAFRHCGMQMQTYEEVTAPAQERLSLTYLEAAVQLDWPAPPAAKMWKDGKLVDAKPWPIKRHVEKLLADAQGVSIGDLRRLLAARAYRFGETAPHPVDLQARWMNIDEEKRRPVEDTLGEMPIAGLEHIPFEAAMHYGCRDVDATLRVFHKLMVRYREMIS